MVHQIEQFSFELPDIEEFLAGDDRTLAFQVVDADGNGVDISSATISWDVYEREYQTDAADAVISDGDSGVEIVTDNRVDSTDGEFEIRVDGAATSDMWGEFYHRPEVEQTDGTVASWRGEIVLTA